MRVSIALGKLNVYVTEAYLIVRLTMLWQRSLTLAYLFVLEPYGGVSDVCELSYTINKLTICGDLLLLC